MEIIHPNDILQDYPTHSVGNFPNNDPRMCPIGSKVTNIRGYSGKYLDKICMSCSTGEDLGCVGNTNVPDNFNINSRFGWDESYAQAGDWIDGIRFDKRYHPSQYLTWHGMNNALITNPDAGNVPMVCPIGEVIVGFNAIGGNYVDRIQMECAPANRYHSPRHPRHRRTRGMREYDFVFEDLQE